MRDENFELGDGQRAKSVLHGFDLLERDSAIFPGGGPSGVDAQDDELLVIESRRKIGRDVSLVSRQRGKESRGGVVKRNVVVAGNGELRERDLIEISAGGDELVSPGALGEIAAVDDERGLDLQEVFEKAGGDAVVLRIEVKIGNVGDDRHVSANWRGA